MPMALRLSANRPTLPLWKSNLKTVAISRVQNVTAVDGSAPKFFAFIAFDNMTKAKTFIESMKNTTALRTRVTKSRSFIVEGTMR